MREGCRSRRGEWGGTGGNGNAPQATWARSRGSESSSFCPTVRDDALIEVQIELLQCAAFYPALVAFKPRNITLLWLEKSQGQLGVASSNSSEISPARFNAIRFPSCWRWHWHQNWSSHCNGIWHMVDIACHIYIYIYTSHFRSPSLSAYAGNCSFIATSFCNGCDWCDFYGA